MDTPKTQPMGTATGARTLLSSLARPSATYRPLPTVPEFPLDGFDSPVIDLIVEGSTDLGVPPEMIALPLLVAAGATCGNRRRLRLKETWDEFPTIFGALVAAPGVGKTPAINIGTAAVKRLQREAELSSQPDLDDGDEEEASPPRHHYTTNATVESIAPMLVTSPGLLLTNDELLSWVKGMDAYRSAGDRAFWLAAWSHAPLKVDRRSAPTIHVPEPVVGVIGGVQPDRLADLRGDNADDGFVERFLWVYADAEPSLWVRESGITAILEAVMDLFRAISGVPENPAAEIIRLAPPVESRWEEWFNDNARVTRSATGLVRGFHAKLPAHVARLALVLHLLTDPLGRDEYLHADELDAAIDLGAYFKANLERVAQRMAAPPARGSLSSSILAAVIAGGGDLSKTRLHAALGGKVSAGDLEAELALLGATGEVHQVKVPTAGRPSERVRLGTAPQPE